MSVGYLDEFTGKYVKVAGNLNIINTPLATEISNGLMSYQDKIIVDNAFTVSDAATTDDIRALFNKEVG